LFSLPLEFFPLYFSCGFCSWNDKEGLLSPYLNEKWRFASVCLKTTPFSRKSHVLLM
jgi:hypothetical protein